MRPQGNPDEIKPLPIITIDGSAGVGKSTLAALLSDKLGIPYLNTGAMFRTIALKLGEDALLLDTNALKEKLNDIHFSLSPDKRLLCNGENLPKEIYSEKISALASALATNPIIRENLLLEQRKIGAQGSLVADGRDMGTVIFPNARYKFFLMADPQVRARRRYLQYESQGMKADLEELEKKIRLRDEQDQNRPVAPLKAAEDAIIIDTSDLTLEEVLERMNNVIDPDLLANI